MRSLRLAVKAFRRPRQSGQLGPRRLPRGWPRNSSSSASLCLALTLLLASCSRDEQTTVVLITLDTFRADNLTAFGGNRSLAPFLESLSTQSIVFSNAYTSMGTTFPAHASLFTGMYPRDHDVHWNGDRLSEDFTTLAEILSENGFSTAAFVGHKGLLTRGGLNQGFQNTSDAPSGDSGTRPAPEINRLLETWLANDRRPGKPAFVWLHYFDMHTPYQPSDYSDEVHRALGYKGSFSMPTDARDLTPGAVGTPDQDQPDPALEALYRGQLIDLDAAVKQAVDSLQRKFGPVLLLVVADHGEMLGEHGDVLHGGHLWEPVVRVPLILQLPKASPSLEVVTTTSIIDVLPTVLDFLGIESNSPTRGRSLLAVASGESRPRPAFSETRAFIGAEARTHSLRNRQSAVSNGLKAVFDGQSFWHWNLAADPLELHPSAKPFTGALDLEPLLSAYSAGILGREGTSLDPLSPETVRELRAMGYIQ